MTVVLTSGEESLRLLFAAHPLPMWLYDVETLRFVEANDASVAHYGYSREEFLSMRITDLQSPEDGERLSAELRHAPSGLRRDTDITQHLRDGRLIDVEISSHTLDWRGRPVVLVVAHDVTDRKRAEAALHRLNRELEDRVRRRTAQLEAAIDELEAFSYSVSHDLRAPLRSIDGFSQALAEDAGPSLSPAAHRHIERIRTATQRMGTLIDDLLTLSKVSHGEMTREPVDLSEIATRIAAELARTAPARSVRLTIAPGMRAVGDARLLRIVLQNLLDNAWKFTSRSVDPQIVVGQTTDRDCAVYFVRDNGAGFEAAYADKLFAPFQRLHTPSEFPGTGIGLATVRRIVQRHGGRIWAEGAPDEGACFSFTL